ncbi:MAG TPA: hypothetical protein VGS79_04055 [Puia sp.]|nr:hypothetical protein [Puia sp.]
MIESSCAFPPRVSNTRSISAKDAYTARRAMDQNPLFGLQPAVFEQTLPGGKPRQRYAGGGLMIDGCRFPGDLVRPHRYIFRIGSITADIRPPITFSHPILRTSVFVNLDSYHDASFIYDAANPRPMVDLLFIFAQIPICL